MVAAVDIGGRTVGDGAPCFVIAEAGVNHNGRADWACELADAARRAGADAVKFQTFSADRLVTADAPKADYQRSATGDQGGQLEMLRALELSRDAHLVVLEHCRRAGILFLSTPFDEDSADFLDQLGVPGFKISSGELTNLPLLVHVARKAKPMIVSTGMASLEEVAAAVAAITAAGNAQIVLLQCVSSYPAAPATINLRAMKTMREAFDLPVGYSDHTLGSHVALAAVALGACVVEKHLTLSRSLPGPDHQASMQPEEFAELARAIRTVEKALGDGRKEPAPGEAAIAAVARKSLVAAMSISQGTVITEDLIAVKRPGTGLPPAMRADLVGRTASVTIPRGALIRMDMFE